VAWKSIRASFMVWFIPFLLLTLITELGGVFYKYVLDRNNAWLYNVYLLLQVAFFSVLYYHYIRIPAQRKLILATSLIFIVAATGFYVFTGSWNSFNVIIFVTGGFMVTSFAVLFLLYYFSLDKTEEEAALLPLIFITTGVVIYFSVVSITITLYKYLQFYNSEWAGVKLYNLIPRILSIIMYSLFTYAFYLCSKRKILKY
jgi:hypothetical protein